MRELFPKKLSKSAGSARYWARMKGTLAIFGLAVAGVAGYFMEPSMRYQLTGLAPGEVVAKAGVVASAGDRKVAVPQPVVPPETAPASVPVPAPVPEPAPVVVPEPLVPEPPAVAQVAPEPAVEGDGGSGLVPGVAVVPEVPPAPQPEAEPEPAAPEPVAPPAGPVDVVAVMKKHIADGNIKEFTFQQVAGWKVGAEEVIDGETYQTGLIRYNAETIFGTKLIEAKALIRDGEVVKWIWPKSNMEIK